MKQLALFGGALDSGNLGVAALGTAVVQGADQWFPDARVTIFDNGWGQGRAKLVAGTRTLTYDRAGARLSRRYHQPESYKHMMVSARFGGLLNPGVKLLRGAAATLDVSGGDSFTDMYGPKTFRAVMMPKLLAERVGSPLVLLPQTYGPFYDSDARALAARILRGAHQAWARDAKGYETLRDLLGSEFDETRHHRGVDMAFGLSPTEPASADSAGLKAWLAADGPVAGLNVSGLLVGPKPPNMTHDAIAIDYAAAVAGFVQKLLDESDARVLMVPHVSGTGIPEESDDYAVSQIVERVGGDTDRIRVASTQNMTANEAKWWISQCDWFSGTRMHSTIAALSSGVPTAAIAYSLKTEPVFATVGQADQVIDARSAKSDAEVIAHLWNSWLDRDAGRASLAASLPEFRTKVDAQMQNIMASCAATAR